MSIHISEKLISWTLKIHKDFHAFTFILATRDFGFNNFFSVCDLKKINLINLTLTCLDKKKYQHQYH